MSKRSSKPRNSHTQKGLRLAVLFCILVVGIIAFSALIRGAGAFKNSSFGDFRYNISVHAGIPQVVSLTKDNETDSKVKILSFENYSELRPAIPTNSTIEVEEKLTTENFKARFLPSVLKGQNDIAMIDRIKIALFILRIGSKEIDSIEASGYTNAQVGNMLSDPLISEEAKSVEIINASGEPGLGNYLADSITIAGGNVVLVKGSDMQIEKSIIKYKEDSLTIKYLVSYLKFQIEKKDFESLADIQIILGEETGDRGL